MKKLAYSNIFGVRAIAQRTQKETIRMSPVVTFNNSMSLKISEKV